MVGVGRDLSSVVGKSLENSGLTLQRGDVIALASKVVSTCEGRIVKLRDVPVSSTAKRLARKWKVDIRHLAQVVLNEGLPTRSLAVSLDFY